MDNIDRDALLILTLTPGLGPRLIRRCIESMGSAQAVLNADTTGLTRIEGIGSKRAGDIRSALDRLEDGHALEREKELIAQQGVSLLGIDELGYPRLLRLIADPPPLLYVRGQWHEDDALALAVVGTRRCTAYGREQADRFSAICSQAGLCIVSGGARGIDAAAHRSTLRVRGRTVAVLGSGLAKPYPTEHAELFDTIAAGNGAVISEFPMTTPPIAENFPRRNRIVSGLALGVLVIEAPTGSGALITARLAAEDHGREVLAVPGRVDSRVSGGCHKMLREGWATLVTNAADVLDALGDAGQLLKVNLVGNPQPQDQAPPVNAVYDKLTGTQKRLFEALDEPRTLDQLTAKTGLGVPAIQADLTMLEVRGLVQRDRGLCRQRQRG